MMVPHGPHLQDGVLPRPRRGGRFRLWPERHRSPPPGRPHGVRAHRGQYGPPCTLCGPHTVSVSKTMRAGRRVQRRGRMTETRQCTHAAASCSAMNDPSPGAQPMITPRPWRLSARLKWRRRSSPANEAVSGLPSAVKNGMCGGTGSPVLLAAALLKNARNAGSDWAAVTAVENVFEPTIPIPRQPPSVLPKEASPIVPSRIERS